MERDEPSGHKVIDLSYKQAGIDYSKMDPFKILAQQAAAKTAAYLERIPDLKEVAASRGETAYLLELPDMYIAHVEETLGTKNLVADQMQEITGRCYYRAIAQDTVAAIVNDLVARGAFPVSIAMHLAAGSSSWFDNHHRLEELITGWSDACRLARCAWGGGETPTLKDILSPMTVQLSGSAVGLLQPKSRRIRGNIQDGDAIVLLGSSGIHTNGITLARQIASRLPDGYTTRLEGGNLPFSSIQAIFALKQAHLPRIVDSTAIFEKT